MRKIQLSTRSSKEGKQSGQVCGFWKWCQHALIFWFAVCRDWDRGLGVGMLHKTQTETQKETQNQRLEILHWRHKTQKEKREAANEVVDGVPAAGEGGGGGRSASASPTTLTPPASPSTLKQSQYCCSLFIGTSSVYKHMHCLQKQRQCFKTHKHQLCL